MHLGVPVVFSYLPTSLKMDFFPSKKKKNKKKIKKKNQVQKKEYQGL
jgi:hypothetical protein